MRTRQLGNSGIGISEIGLGSWLTYAVGIERERSEACTRAAFNLGITFFDTANVYGHGAAETAWSEVLSTYPRESYVLATKLWGEMPDGKGFSAEQVRRQLDASPRRLRTDYVDLYQLHRFDLSVPIAKTLGAMTDAVRVGKVQEIGFSEWTPEQIEAALALPDVARLSSSQSQYSMLWRASEKEVFPLCHGNDMSQVVWSPLAEGVLTSKYLPGEAPPAGSHATSSSMSAFVSKRIDNATLQAVQRRRPIADGLSISIAQLALTWILRRVEVASAIVGASRPEQLQESVAASRVTLAATEAALGGVPQRDPALGVFAEPGLGASAA